MTMYLFVIIGAVLMIVGVLMIFLGAPIRQVSNESKEDCSGGCPIPDHWTEFCINGTEYYKKVDGEWVKLYTREPGEGEIYTFHIDENHPRKDRYLP